MKRVLATTINPIENSDCAIPVEEIIRRICKPGFRVLDFNFFGWVRNPSRSPFVQKDWRDWMEKARKAAEQYHAVFFQTHAPIYNQFDYNPFFDDMTERSIEGTALCGASWIVIHPGFHKPSWQEENLDRAKGDNLRWFEKYVRLAEKHNVGIMIENQIGTYGSNLEQLADLVDAFGTERVRICWDTGHGHVSGYRQKEALTRIGGRLAGLHIHDNSGLTDSHMRPGEGNIDWRDFMDGLDTIGYRGPLMFETNSGVRGVSDEMADEGLRRIFESGVWLNSISEKQDRRQTD